MHLSVGRSMAMISVATALRNVSGFVGILRVSSKYSAGEPNVQKQREVQPSHHYYKLRLKSSVMLL